MAVSSLLALSLTLSSGAAAQDVAGKVTYSSPGIAAGKALKELSPKVGLTLLASPTTENEILVLSLKDAPVKEVLAKLAWAVGGSWKKEGEAYRLARTSEDHAAERARERNNILEGYEKVLAKRKKDLAAAGELTAAKAELLAKEAVNRMKSFNPESRSNDNFWQFSSKLTNESPGGRAMSKLMSLVSAADLADLPKGIRVVYSTHPTRTQRSLGGAATAIVSAFQRDQAIWMDAMSKHRVANPQFGGTTYMIFPDLMSSEDGQPDVQGRKVGKVLLTMTRSSYPGSGVMMELLLADAKGKIIARGNGHIWPSAWAWENPTPPPKDDPKVIRGADMETIAAGTNERTNSTRVPEELRKRLLQPETYEPLGILSGQTAINAAKVTKVNLIASLSDTNASYGVGAKETPYTLWKRGLQMTSEVVEEKGWLTMRPFAAASSREVFIDRKTLGAYLRRKVAVGRMKVEEAALWAVKLPLEEEAPLPRLLLNYAGPLDSQDRYGGGDGRILRFFGSLTPAQRTAAKQGGLPLSRLDPDQLAIVQRLVYGEHVNLMPDFQKAQEMKVDMNDFYNGVMREPTESLPNGIPPQGTLEITEATSEVAFTMDSEAEGYIRPSQGMDANQIAWQQFAESRPDLFPWMKEAYQKVDLTRLRMGRRTSYTITLKFTPLLSLMHGLEDRDYTTADPIAFNALPAAFRQQVTKQIEDYRKSYANSQPGNSTPATHSTPPPLR